ncbi:PepSY domain-containing protein [Chitinophaga horti]|uniref:PepSY domain-containing protein n=1 Tax=Chitinophaga horti TaxID=2920382 RepID=A0ABY6J511_9BACT|nr:PepSY-associated TM helix domain-containing protein [Chitinophaga horti]UYQ93386.1 PepSY domain-containing protein [Chitinophaga horti]
MKQQKRLRWAKHQSRWFGKWHLYLGIIAGAIVAFTGLTGSILVFDDEIDRALNRELFDVLAQQQKIPLGEAITVIGQKHPTIHLDYIQNLGDKPNDAYHGYNFDTEEQFFFNPYTGDLSGKRIYETSFIHVVTDLHTSLLVPVAGQYIVGLATLCLLILTISGLRLWIPDKWKQLKSVLTVNFKASFKRQNYDWHNVLGFYSAPVVSLLSLTGVCITFSMLVVPLLFILSGQPPQGVAKLLSVQSIYVAGAQPLSPAEIVRIAEQHMPGSRAAGISLPHDSVSNWRIDMLGTRLPVEGNREMIMIDQYSGKILLSSRADFPDVGNAYLSWLTPIHYGSFGGLPTQILAIIGGLMPLVLFVTGFIIWWPRYKKQRKNGERPRQEKVPVLQQASLSGWLYFVFNIKKGMQYAACFVVVGALMGALYGLIRGIVIQPAVFTLLFTTVLVVINFAVALPVFLVAIPFKRARRAVTRYFALSLSFAAVFVGVYWLLTATGLKIF